MAKEKGSDYMMQYDEYFKQEGFGIGKPSGGKYGSYHSKAMTEGRLDIVGVQLKSTHG